MSMVFERYPNGGGEMLLALALADHAHDDGTHIYPGIALLAAKTRQSERAVQYQLRRMERSGWLELLNAGNGGRNLRREYRINPSWISGENFAPFFRKGANDGDKGCKVKPKRVQSDAENGAIILHPHITISEPSFESSLESLPQSIPREKPDPTLPASTTNPNGIFAMSIDWRPRETFDDLLAFAGLKDYPWEDELPEFVIFRLGADDRMSQGSWEHKFVQTLKRNAYHRSIAGNEPTQIPVDWEPPREMVHALLANGMTRKFLDDAVLEFVTFWRDAGNAARSWNAKFLQHVKAQWARQPPQQQSAFEQLTDRSWAAGLIKDLDEQHCIES